MDRTARSDRRVHVVVVEDDDLVLAMTTEVLESAGLEVSAFTAAEDALGRAMMDLPFDVLFTDIDLAGPMDGWELAEAIREMRPDAPIICTSGRSYRDEFMCRVPRLVFVPKPYSPVGICSLIQSMIMEQENAAAVTMVPEVRAHRPLRNEAAA